jgi:hypothetical protein
MLRGTLLDLGVVEVVQLPVSAGRTGELVIATIDHDARLYYVDGRLVHLVMDNLRGRSVLDEIVAWSDGEFEFRADVLTDEASFDGDVAQELRSAMRALQETEAMTESSGKNGDPLGLLLEDFVSANDFATHACVTHSDGTLNVCAPTLKSPPAWFDNLRNMIFSMVTDYPRGRLNRMLFEDDQGSLVATRFEDGTALVVASKVGATLGAVTVGVERLARKIRHVKKG